VGLVSHGVTVQALGSKRHRNPQTVQWKSPRFGGIFSHSVAAMIGTTRNFLAQTVSSRITIQFMGALWFQHVSTSQHLGGNPKFRLKNTEKQGRP